MSEKKLRAVTEASSPAARVEGVEGERSEPGATGGRAAGAAADRSPAPDPEVPEKAKRRTFTAAYKRRILEKADALEGTGEIGAMLRREGLYSSHLSKWRRQRDAGALAGLTDPEKKRQVYCHCPRVRDALKTGVTISPAYCYCGAGFYKGIWEEILQAPVEVEVLKSVLKGDQVCTIAIHLPRER